MRKTIYLGNRNKLFEYRTIGQLQEECRNYRIAICGNATLGRNVTLGEGVKIGKAVKIGNDVVLGNNVNIGDGVPLPDDLVIKDNTIGYMEDGEILFQLGEEITRF